MLFGISPAIVMSRQYPHVRQVFVSLLTLLVPASLAVTEATASEQQKLKFMMYEQTPMLSFNSGTAGGLVGSRAQRILENSGLDYTLELVPPRRILLTLKNSGAGHCTFAFFKTAERQEFAHYSRPFYQNAPQGIVTKKSNLEKFAKHGSFRDVLKDKQLYMGHMSGVSLGAEADDLVKKLGTNIVFGNSLERIFQMLDKDRFDYIHTNKTKAWAAFDKFSLDEDEYTILIHLTHRPAANAISCAPGKPGRT